MCAECESVMKEADHGLQELKLRELPLRASLTVVLISALWKGVVQASGCSSQTPKEELQKSRQGTTHL